MAQVHARKRERAANEVVRDAAAARGIYHNGRHWKTTVGLARYQIEMERFVGRIVYVARSHGQANAVPGNVLAGSDCASVPLTPFWEIFDHEKIAAGDAVRAGGSTGSRVIKSEGVLTKADCRGPWSISTTRRRR